MMNPRPQSERLLDLLADQATVGLSAAEQAELDLLLAAEGGDPSVELAAAAIELAEAGALEPMPAGLRASLESAGLAAVEAARISNRENAPLRFPEAARRGNARMWGGWLAAAACLTVAAAGWWTAAQRGGSGGGGPGQTGPGGPRLGSMAQMEKLAAEPGSVRMAWGDFALNDQAPEIAGVKGEVVWNESQQKGFLVFEGLPANDPSKEQYQLWIVDSRGMADASGQSARISGAIFNAEAGTFVVPIEPAIPVKGAGAFAVTIEQPGGTWVSDMTRRVVIAAEPSG